MCSVILGIYYDQHDKPVDANGWFSKDSSINWLMISTISTQRELKKDLNEEKYRIC